MFSTRDEEYSEFKYTQEEIENLPPESKKEYYRMTINQILKKNSNGITVSQISSLTGFDTRTVAKHLEFLVAIREAYKKEFGPRTIVYFPNGRLAHPFSDKTYEIGGSYFTFKEIHNDLGEFLYIQEKKKDYQNNTFTVAGGIIVPKNALDKFILNLKRIEEEVNIP